MTCECRQHRAEADNDLVWAPPIPLRCRAGARNLLAACALRLKATRGLDSQTTQPNRMAPVHAFPKHRHASCARGYRFPKFEHLLPAKAPDACQSRDEMKVVVSHQC